MTSTREEQALSNPASSSQAATYQKPAAEGRHGHWQVRVTATSSALRCFLSQWLRTLTLLLVLLR